MALGGGVMAKFTFKGLNEYARRLSKLGDQAERVAGKAIYAAADIVTDEIRTNIEAIPVLNKEDLKHHRRNGITQTAKYGLLDSLGIASMEKDAKGLLNVKVGFDGYNKVHTKTYPNGQPNALIARSVESGTSFMEPHPFVRPAVNKTRRAALKKMEEVIEEETKKIMG